MALNSLSAIQTSAIRDDRARRNNHPLTDDCPMTHNRAETDLCSAPDTCSMIYDGARTNLCVGSHSGMDPDTSAHSNFRALANLAPGSKHDHVADHRTPPNSDRLHDDIAIRQAHVGADGGLVGQIRSLFELEQWQVSQPCVGIDLDRKTSLVTE